MSRLGDIFTAPFLHFSWQHIEGNSVPLFVLGVLAAYRSIGRFLLTSLIVAVTSGMAVWLFQSGNELTVGASGLIFGYFGYVLVRGFFDRSLVDIGVGLVAGALYWTILAGRHPGHARGELDRPRRRPGRRRARGLAAAELDPAPQAGLPVSPPVSPVASRSTTCLRELKGEGCKLRRRGMTGWHRGVITGPGRRS